MNTPPLERRCKMCEKQRLHVMAHSDIPECAEVFVAVFGRDPWNEAWTTAEAEARLDAFFSTPGAYGTLARSEDGRVLGFAMGHAEQWCRGRHFYLREMCVLPDRQREGIGSELFRALVGGLSKMDVSVVYLMTARKSTAEAFYEKHGFDSNPDMVLMGKPIDP